MENDVMWVSLDGRTIEHLQLETSEESVEADGLIIRVGEDSCIHYKIECDFRWRVRKLEIIRSGNDHSGSLILLSDGSGHWKTEQDEPLKDLEGCIDVDIYASPFTNTIAIRRLGLKPKEVQTIRACFVSLPDLQVSAVPQRYTLQNLNDSGAMYLYEGLTSGFKTDLPIDQNGFVIDYPQFFRRIL